MFRFRNYFAVLCCLLLRKTSSQHNGTPQPNVLTAIKEHALHLWIHLSPKANFTECVRIAANLSSFVYQIPQNPSSDKETIRAGVGFGNNIWSLVSNSSLRFPYYYRKGAFGDMPDTGGDILVHAKSNTFGKLYGLAKLFISKFPKGSIKCFEDTYSFVFEDFRDLSLFIDGTVNPPLGSEERVRVAIVPSTGGSFCITQKWVHNFNRIVNLYAESTLESFIGRTRSTSEELQNKSACSHVARIVGSTEYNATRKIQIHRQALSYGTVSGKAGNFFLAFAANVSNFDIMLDHMVGKTIDGISDCLMKISQCIQSTYWYFPSIEELKQLRGSW